MTADLEDLGEWLKEMRVTHAVMESTGVYWRPVYEVLEESVNLILVNAQHFHALPGRKTDTADAEWLAELLGHGLVKASFVPPRWQRELRELTRFRRNLVQRRVQVVNELQKTLETANIKLAGVVSDITGVSATEMLRSLGLVAEHRCVRSHFDHAFLRNEHLSKKIPFEFCPIGVLYFPLICPQFLSSFIAYFFL